MYLEIQEQVLHELHEHDLPSLLQKKIYKYIQLNKWSTMSFHTVVSHKISHYLTANNASLWVHAMISDPLLFHFYFENI